MYKYTVYFEGISEVISNEPLSEEEIFDKAYDNIYSGTCTGIDNFELLDTEEI